MERIWIKGRHEAMLIRGLAKLYNVPILEKEGKNDAELSVPAGFWIHPDGLYISSSVLHYENDIPVTKTSLRKIIERLQEIEANTIRIGEDRVVFMDDGSIKVRCTKVDPKMIDEIYKRSLKIRCKGKRESTGD